MKRKAVNKTEKISHAPEFSEEEMQEWSKSVNLNRVESLLWAKIRKNGDLSTSTQPAVRARRLKWPLILAALLIFALSGTALAYQQGYLTRLFGSAANSDEIVQAAAGQKSDGVVMTHANVVSSEYDAIVVMAFERTDGKPFPDQAYLQRVQSSHADSRLSAQDDSFQADHRGNIANQYLVNQNRTLLYYLEIHSSGEPLQGQTLKVEADGIMGVDVRDEELDLTQIRPLSDYCAVLPSVEADGSHHPATAALFTEMHSRIERLGRIPLPLDTQYPEIQFKGIGFQGADLHLTVSNPDPGLLTSETDLNRSPLPYGFISELRDSRTGEVFHNMILSPGTQTADGRTFLYDSSFYQLVPADLPYLTPIVSYRLKEPVSNGHWEFSYSFETSSPTIHKALDLRFPNTALSGKPVESEPTGYRLTELSLSSFDLVILGMWEGAGTANYEYPSQLPTVNLLRKDGSEVELWAEISGNDLKSDGKDGADFKLRYTYPPLSGSESALQFVDQNFLDQIQAVIIDQELVPLR